MASPDSQRDAPAAAPAVFKVPPGALVAAVFLALCLSPIAFQGGAWFALFVLPLIVIGLVLWVRTTVDADGLHVRVLGTTSLPWSEVATLRLIEKRWVRAVPVEGARRRRELTLVNVQIRDLGRLGEASDGHISVPTPAEAAAAEEHRRELEATQMRIAKLREGSAPADATADASADASADAPADASAGDGHDVGR